MSNMVVASITISLFYTINNNFFRVVMVVGAGRGPLVQATLNASLQAGTHVKIYAVEKNPGAVIT